MKAYLDIIRWKNLLFLLFIQWLMFFSVVFPIFQTFGFTTSDYNLQVVLLIATTLLITAGGYVINDYFDVKIDKINKPEKVIIGHFIQKKNAMLYYQILTGLGMSLGLIIAIWVRSFTLGFIFVITPGMLWFYSASYKRQFLIGNLIVSLSTALSILIIGFLGVSILKMQYKNLIGETPIPTQIYTWIGGFSAFAFILTCIREIIKDAEDIEGDRELECRTLPIRFGIKKTKTTLISLVIFTILAILHVQFRLIPFDGMLSLKYVLIALILPLVILVAFIIKSKNANDWYRASTWSKLIMLSGVFYSLIFYYLQAKKYHLILFGIFMINT